MGTPTAVVSAQPAPSTGRWRTIRDTISAVAGAVLGIAPHVLHHIGLLAGAALLTGALGNGLLFISGLALSVPMLRRLYWHFRSWRAPALAVAVFTLLFSLSAFVIGPAISGIDDALVPPSPTVPSPSPTHDHDH